jgi:outer membrane protein assembly factor BamB
LAIVDDKLIVGGYSYIYGLDRSNGQVLWRQSEGASYYQETVIGQNVGYFAPSEMGGYDIWYLLLNDHVMFNTLKAIDLSTGRELWSHSNHLTDKPFSRIYATDRVLLVESGEGTITATPLED